MNWNKVKICIKLLLDAVIIASVIFVGIGLYKSYSNRKSQEKLKSLVETAEVESEMIQPEKIVSGESESKQLKESDTKEGSMKENDSIDQSMFLEAEGTEPTLQILPEYATLYELNNELVGWLTIDNTGIDYPVMKGEDDEYYLKHDFEGNEDKHGCLFVKSFVDVDAYGVNVIIYGHNMKDGSMFGPLKQYKKEDFYKEHPYILFHSLYQKRTYEIVAVFLSQVYLQNYEGFKYYKFYQADTEEEFLYFYDNIKELSLYDTGVEAEYGDRFITLSTCEYHVEDGRLVVVAKEIKP